MDRHLLEKHLSLSEQHVTQSERRIARQHEIIFLLRHRGHDTTVAQEVLAQVESAQSLHIAERNRLRQELLRSVDNRYVPLLDVERTDLANLLGVLVQTAVYYADGKARAAVYLADAAETKLHHLVGMSPAYARHVDGFPIGRQSLACGLAAATKQAVVTQDVFEEPRWKQWAWLAEQFGYRACWSFPVLAPSGKALGSFAMYYPEPREAKSRDLEVAALLTRTAASIISCH
jgi:GAF domain-containing protein